MKNFLIVSIILSSFTFTVQAKENDFDKICSYFQLLGNKKNVNAMSMHERNDFILDKINTFLIQDSNARVSWVAISNAVANQRYELFQSSAESVLKVKWQCKAMEKWAPVTGEF